VDVVTATAANIDMHLNMLRGAIHSFGGSVEVVEVSGGVCKIKYSVGGDEPSGGLTNEKPLTLLTVICSQVVLRRNPSFCGGVMGPSFM
jgi:hypothetical protein